MLTPDELAAAKRQLACMRQRQINRDLAQELREAAADRARVSLSTTIGAGTCSPFERLRWQESGQFSD